MALNAYMRLTGETQGEIRGSVTQRGRSGSMMVIAFDHEVVSPRDAASGLPTGKRQHKPFTITKEIDTASPLLMKAFVHNENLTKMELTFWQPSRSGREVRYFVVTLINASIAGIRQEMLNNKYPENMQHKEREHISFCYQKIEWSHVRSGTTSEDDWEAPNV
ncbi:MAG: Hcp family type VI secretion system effector [Bacteroidota bacterium]